VISYDADAQQELLTTEEQRQAVLEAD
jgi:hypothetical protein